MGARNHPDAEGLPYFITCNTEQRRRVFDDAAAGELFTRTLTETRPELGFLLLAYVIMPDHVHLIVLPGPRAGLSRIMQFVKGRFARRYNQLIGSTGKIWQSRYYETIVWDEAALFRQIAYVEANPVMAGLVEQASDWSWSSAVAPTGDLQLHLGVGVSSSSLQAPG